MKTDKPQNADLLINQPKNMSDERTSMPRGVSSGQFFKLVVGILVFGVLMALRTEFDQIWLRAVVAACAGGVLAWALLQARKSKR